MGLDIYLYKYEISVGKAERIKDQCEKECNRVWKGKCYDKLSDKKKEQLQTKCDKIRAKWDPGKVETSIDLPSKKHPNFKIGYIRSSYNSAGTNSFLQQMIGADLYWIFNRKKDEEYAFVPNWKESKKRCEAALKRLNKVIEDVGGCRIFDVFPPIHKGPKNDAEALEIYKKELAQHRKNRPDKGPFAFDCYSNGSGVFAMGGDGIKLRGIIHGTKTDILSGKEYQSEYIIYESDDKFEWYVHQLEVIIEMCEWVLEQEDPKRYALHWSG
jgi:hypothetical protein